MHEERLHDELALLYGGRVADRTVARVVELLAEQPRAPGRRVLTERDVVLIAYPDHLRSARRTPLGTLGAFVTGYLSDAVSAIHVLPFHPYSSDDGYAVTNCDAVDPAHGTWEDLDAIERRFRLMYDLVLNHVSSEHPWFRAFLRGDERYRGYFITPPPEADLSTVRRPRATPLLTRFDGADGEVRVWTTFGPDQVDLNYADPDVLLDVMRVLFRYVRRGAYMVRLDAVGFVWKEPGTESIHLPGTHTIVRILRHALDVVAPDVRLVAETNVPHAENVTYLGPTGREAQLVYNFALPPLLVHTLHTGDATVLSRWASELVTPMPSAAFLNFTASHDGIGVTPLHGILSREEILQLVARVVRHGALVTERSVADGSLEPYELNVAYIDALSPPDDPVELRVDRFMATQAIMLALKGVPAVYLNSLLGSGSWPEGVAELGHKRAINRRKLVVGGDGDDALDIAELHDPGTQRGLVHRRYLALLRARRSLKPFHPRAAQTVLDLDPRVFAVERATLDSTETVLALHNVSADEVAPGLPPGDWREVLTAAPVQGRIRLAPYQVAWLHHG